MPILILVGCSTLLVFTSSVILGGDGCLYFLFSLPILMGMFFQSSLMSKGASFTLVLG